MISTKDAISLTKKKLCNWESALVLIILAVFSIFLLKNYRLFGRTVNSGDGVWRFAFVGLYFLILATIVHLWMKSGIKNEKKPIEWMRLLICTNFMGITWHFVLENIFHREMKKMLFIHVAFSIGIAMVVFCVLFLVFHSLKMAVLVGSFVYFAWAVAEYYTQLFRGLPMQITDILDFKTAMTVAGQYKFELTGPIVFYFIYLSLIVINIWLEEDYVLGMKLWNNLLMRGIGIGIAIWGIWFLGWSTTFDNWGIRVDGNRPVASFKQYGTQLSFISSARETIIREPENYSVTELKKIASQYEEEEKDGKRPNIIAIMNETFADYEILGEIKTSEEILPNYNMLKENAIKGNMMVSTIGGGTGKTEYEFLTGNSMHLYSPSLSPYVMLGNKMKNSLASKLAEQGYATYAMHPFTASNYNRENTYSTMGFQDFISGEEFQDANRVRDFVSDESCYNRIFELVEETKEPLFTFCVTIQNHSPYTDEKFKPTVKLIDTECGEAEQYLSLIHESDKQIEKIINYFESSNEPTMVIFFGDHFPRLPDEFCESVTGVPRNQEDFQMQQKYYTTPFFIWANYDIEEESDVMIGANTLGSYALDKAGVKLSGYNKYLLDLREKIPAFSGLAYYGKDGKYHSFSEEEHITELLGIYDSFQYNEMFDKKNFLEDFFE